MALYKCYSFSFLFVFLWIGLYRPESIIIQGQFKGEQTRLPVEFQTLFSCT